MKSEILTQAVQLSDPQHHLFHGLNYMKFVTLVSQNIHRIFQIAQQKKYFLIYMPQSPTLQKTLLLILWQIIKEVGKSSLFLRNLKMVVEQTSLEKQKTPRLLQKHCTQYSDHCGCTEMDSFHGIHLKPFLKKQSLAVFRRKVILFIGQESEQQAIQKGRYIRKLWRQINCVIYLGKLIIFLVRLENMS